MRQSQKINAFFTVGILVAIISLSLSIGILNTSYSNMGVARENKQIFSVKLDDVSDLTLENSEMAVVRQPEIKFNVITYGLILNKVGDFGFFSFDIKNDGNVDTKVKDIKIEVSDNLKAYIDVKVQGLEDVKKIEGGKVIDNVKVTTKYIRERYDENNFVSPLLISEIKIIVEFEQ